VVLLVATISFQSTFDGMAKDAVNKRNFDLANSFFYYASAKEDDKYLSTYNTDKIKIEVQPVLTKQPHYTYNASNKKYETLYDTVEESIAFSFFYVPDFSKGNNAKVHFVTTNNKECDLFFNSKDSQETDINYRINFFDYQAKYHFLTIYITKTDWVSNINDLNDTVKSFQLIDNNNNIVCSYEFNEKYPQIESNIYKDLRPYIDEYNSKSIQKGHDFNSGNVEIFNKAKKELDKQVDAHSEHYIKMAPSSAVIKSDKMVFTFSLATTIYLIVSVLVGNFIFTFPKKKGIYKSLQDKETEKAIEEKQMEVFEKESWKFQKVLLF